MEKYYVNLRVEGGKSEINELLSLLAKIQYLGQIGANDTIPVVVEGDGSGMLPPNPKGYNLTSKGGKTVATPMEENKKKSKKSKNPSTRRGFKN